MKDQQLARKWRTFQVAYFRMAGVAISFLLGFLMLAIFDVIPPLASMAAVAAAAFFLFGGTPIYENYLARQHPDGKPPWFPGGPRLRRLVRTISEWAKALPYGILLVILCLAVGDWVLGVTTVWPGLMSSRMFFEVAIWQAIALVPSACLLVAVVRATGQENDGSGPAGGVRRFVRAVAVKFRCTRDLFRFASWTSQPARA